MGGITVSFGRCRSAVDRQPLSSRAHSRGPTARRRMHLLAEPSFGAALRSLRQQQGLSLAGLSQRVHYSKSYLSKVENGERSATAELARCCDQALGALGALAVLAPERPARRGARGSPGPTPAQLPPSAPALVGRAAELERLDAASTGPSSMVTVIVGPPGVGKTALALHWAHLAASQFPDGCLFANLRGFDPGGTPAEPGAVLD